MTVHDIVAFVVVFSLLIVLGATYLTLREITVGRVGLLFVALAMLGLAAWLGTKVAEEQNYLELLITKYRLFNKRQLLATLFASGAAIPYLVLAARGAGLEMAGLWQRRVRGLVPLATICSFAVAGLAALGFAWNELYRDTRILRPGYGFTAREVAKFPHYPIRVVSAEVGKLFVSADRADNGFDYGLLYEIKRDDSGEYGSRAIAEQAFLFRPYGLAYSDGSLYVSRSGHQAKVVQGEIVYANTGAVTQLRDLSGDGNFDYAHDVITDLPGSRGPDPQHQNNGIALGPDQSLYVLQGNPSDRAPTSHPWEGTVLRLKPGADQPEVFAKGFRNPFSLAFGPDDALFVVDNDVDVNPGDEINHVLEGEHYGHPWAIGAGNQSREFRDPVFLGDESSNLCGLAYSDSPRLPEALRGALFVTDLHNNRVLWIRLEKLDESYKVLEQGVLASVPSPVDLAIDAEGEIFVLSRFAKKLYQLSPPSAEQ